MSTMMEKLVDNNSAEFSVLRCDLTSADAGKENVITGIRTDDDEVRSFLFSLGCYEGEFVTLVSVLSDTYVISLKDARYSIDRELAESILL